ncbi:transmembrane protein 121B-like [Ylistrum balloti]|uniref:transmembrane protein 121B-like n=1 Tax=Ylistrum balloti TaxID=509963 RepID=UPI002905E9F3|nr:transmembrane protein 121B-like [Ylistrum balloti]
MGNSCVNCCNAMYQIPTRVLCFVLVLAQGGILDYYLVNHKNIYWYGWVAADVAIGLVFMMTFLISYRHLSIIHRSRGSGSTVRAGSLPLCYFAWFVYSVFLGARVFIIYQDIARTLNEASVFGPNTLKMTISTASFVFVLLLLTHHDAIASCNRRYRIEELSGTVLFDVLDSIDVLNIFFNQSDIDEISSELELSILIVASLNFLVPVLSLMMLNRTHFGHKGRKHYLVVLHKLSIVAFTNLPLFIIRMLLWHVHSQDISIFPMKNIIMIFLAFHDLYDERREDARPKRRNYSEEKDHSRVEEVEENKTMFTGESKK